MKREWLRIFLGSLWRSERQHKGRLGYEDLRLRLKEIGGMLHDA